ncbi:MAG: hypothetical protein U0736_21355 [Gemmataceae bacterium]
MLARHLVPVALVALAAVLAPARAETPRDELLRYLPADVGFCLVVQDLRGRLGELTESPFAERWRRSVLGKELLASREWKQLRDLTAALEKHLGVGWKQFRDDILGDAVVLAFRPGPPGKPEEDQELLLVRAGNPRLLARLVARLNEVQRASGELTELEEREHRGVSYVRRVENRATSYYLLRGPVLLFTSKEPLLRLAIDAERGEPAAGGFAARFRALGIARAPVALLVNPRAFDEAIAARAAADPGSRPIALLWKGLQGFGLAVDTDADLRLTAAVRVRLADLPPAARRFFPKAADASALWATVPADALLAVGGRTSPAAWYELIGELLSPDGRRRFERELARSIGAMLGRDVVRDVLPAVGPDWIAYLTAPTESSKSLLPSLTAAIRLARGSEDDPLDATIVQAIHSFAQLGVLAHNKAHPDRPLTVRTTTRGGIRIRSLVGAEVFPPGVEPSFALKGGFLVVGSTPAAVVGLRVPTETPPVGAGAPLLRASVTELRAYLQAHRDRLTEAMTRQNRLTAEQAGARLAAVLAGLELVDRLELRQHTADGLLSFVLTVRPAAPLRKAP